VLAKLGPKADLSKLDTKGFYGRLAAIIGQWSAEQDRLNISPLVKTFNAMGRDLERIAKILSAQEVGLQDLRDTEVVLHLGSILASDPEVGSRRQANKLIGSFRDDAATLAHACLITAQELRRQVGKSGRPRGDWYDDFTALLLEIAAAAGVEPSSGKDRVSGERVGWLVDAAQALETFVEPGMRSPSREACGKRLEHSRNTPKQLHRQNPSSA
jgi:hypothetical protein